MPDAVRRCCVATATVTSRTPYSPPGKLFLHVRGFPDDGAPAGDLDSPFGVDPAVPVRAERAGGIGWRAGGGGGGGWRAGLEDGRQAVAGTHRELRAGRSRFGQRAARVAARADAITRRASPCPSFGCCKVLMPRPRRPCRRSTAVHTTPTTRAGIFILYRQPADRGPGC